MATKEDIINNIMDYMDFEKIHTIMKFLNWQWATSEGVPTIPEIRVFLRKQLNNFIDRDLILSSCGGFTITKSDNIIRAAFELTTWEVDLDDNFKDEQFYEYFNLYN